MAETEFYKIPTPNPYTKKEALHLFDDEQKKVKLVGMSGGHKKQSDFTFTYDLWSEPALYQGHTGTCVAHAHCGAISKVLKKNLTDYSILGLVAAAPEHSTKPVVKFIKENGLIPISTYNQNVLGEDFKVVDKSTHVTTTTQAKPNKYYSGLAASDDSWRISTSDYERYAEKLDDVDISRKVYPLKADAGKQIIKDIKKAIDEGGLVTVSIDYPTKGPLSNGHVGCQGNLWLKHPTVSNFWCIPEQQKSDWYKWVKSANDGWHRVVFFAYTESSDDCGAFAIKNSWGSNSGENGVYYMDYLFFMMLTQFRKGNVGVTTILPKHKHRIDDSCSSFIQYHNPVGTYVSVENASYTWYESFGSGSSSVDIGYGVYALVENITDGKEHDFTVTEYNNKSEKKVLTTTHFTLKANDTQLYMIKKGSNNGRVVMYNFGQKKF